MIKNNQGFWIVLCILMVQVLSSKKNATKIIDDPKKCFEFECSDPLIAKYHNGEQLCNFNGLDDCEKICCNPDFKVTKIGKKFLENPPFDQVKNFQARYNETRNIEGHEKQQKASKGYSDNCTVEGLTFIKSFSSSNAPTLIKIQDEEHCYQMVFKACNTESKKDLENLQNEFIGSIFVNIYQKMLRDNQVFLDEEKMAEEKVYLSKVKDKQKAIYVLDMHADDFSKVDQTLLNQSYEETVFSSTLASTTLQFLIGIGDSKDGNFLFNKHRGVTRIDYEFLFDNKPYVDGDALLLRREIFNWLKNANRKNEFNLQSFVNKLTVKLLWIKNNFQKVRDAAKEAIESIKKESSFENLEFDKKSNKWLDLLEKKILKKPIKNILEGILPETGTGKNNWEDNNQRNYKTFKCQKCKQCCGFLSSWCKTKKRVYKKSNGTRWTMHHIKFDDQNILEQYNKSFPSNSLDKYTVTKDVHTGDKKCCCF